VQSSYVLTKQSVTPLSFPLAISVSGIPRVRRRWWESHDAIGFLRASRPVLISLSLVRHADNQDQRRTVGFRPSTAGTGLTLAWRPMSLNGAAVGPNVTLSSALGSSEFDLKPPPSGSHERNIGLIIRQRHIAQHGVVVLNTIKFGRLSDSRSLKVPGSRHQRHHRAALRSAQPAPTAL
jgi:hypothetical protein